MNKFQFGDFETDVDVTDVAFIERYEEAAEKYDAAAKKLPKDGKASVQMKAMCKVFFDTFDFIFGEGTHTKMFGEKQSVDLCATAFVQLIEMVKDHSTTLEKMNSIQPNRAARRAKK